MKQSSAYLVGLCVIGLCIDIICVVTIHFVYQSIHQVGLKELVKNKLLLSSLTTMLLCFVFVVVDWWRILEMYQMNIAFLHSSAVLLVANDVIYYIATILLYVSLILRVYTLFKPKPQYSISTQTTTVILTIIAFDIVAICIFIFLMYNAFSGRDSNNNTTTTTVTELIISAITVIINDVVINCLILYLILSRLYQMIHDLDKTYQSLTLKSIFKFAGASNSNINTNNDINTKVEQNKFNASNLSLLSNKSAINNELNKNEFEQKEIVSLITKLTLLTLISVIFEQLFAITALYFEYNAAINRNKYSQQWFSTFGVICYISRAMEGVCNCIVLNLMFVFNQDYYFICCNFFDTKLKNCCVTCIAKQTIRKRRQLKMYQNLGNNNVNVANQ